MSAAGKHLAVWGTLFQGAPLLGLLGTVVGMIRAFHALGEAGSEATAGDLSRAIDLALYTTFAGLVLALVGMGMILLAHFVYRYRAPWFYSVLWIFAILWLLNIPLGTIAGVAILLDLRGRKQEFTATPPPRTPPAPSPPPPDTAARG